MTFKLISGSSSFTFPLDPQNWTYTPNPRINVQKTLGGQVVQLLGYTVSGSFGGLLHGRAVSRQDAWNDMSLLKSFMINLMVNQRRGVKSHITWVDQGFDFDCAIGDLSIQESVEQTGFTYTIPFTVVNESPMRDGSALSSVFNTIMAQVGFKAPETEGAFHGGSGSLKYVRKITGMSGSGPSVSGDSSSDSGSGTDYSHLSSVEQIRKVQEYARDLVINKYHWSEADFAALVQLWNKESGWNYKAVNKSSGATGIPQSLPASKMATAGADYLTNPETQVRWGLDYIKQRYGSPLKAWAHSQAVNWY